VETYWHQAAHTKIKQYMHEHKMASIIEWCASREPLVFIENSLFQYPYLLDEYQQLHHFLMEYFVSRQEYAQIINIQTSKEIAFDHAEFNILIHDYLLGLTRGKNNLEIWFEKLNPVPLWPVAKTSLFENILTVEMLYFAKNLDKEPNLEETLYREIRIYCSQKNPKQKVETLPFLMNYAFASENCGLVLAIYEFFKAKKNDVDASQILTNYSSKSKSLPLRQRDVQALNTVFKQNPI
jgi:hypothetical protein